MGKGDIHGYIPSCCSFGDIIHWCPLCNGFVCVSGTDIWKYSLDFRFNLFCFALFPFSGGQGILFVYVNCFVRAAMYSYYFLSVYKPMGIKPSITMKKNIKRLQIVGLICGASHPAPVFSIKSFCFTFSDSIFHFGRTFWTRACNTWSWLWLFENFVLLGFGTKCDFHIHRFLSAICVPPKRTTENSMSQYSLHQKFIKARDMNRNLFFW